MDFSEKCFFAFLIAVFVGLGFLGYHAVRNTNKFYAQCDAAGGQVFSTDDHLYCVKKDFFVQ